MAERGVDEVERAGAEETPRGTHQPACSEATIDRCEDGRLLAKEDASGAQVVRREPH